MTHEKYMEQRNELLTAAQELIDAGDLEGATAKQDEITSLDAQWDEITKMNANQNALKGSAKPMNLENKSIPVVGEVVETNKEATSRIDSYVNAWGAYMQGKTLTQDEQAIFDKVNHDFSNAYTHDTGNTSVLIPETVASGIWKRAEDMYPLLSDVRKFAVKGTLTFKKHTGITAGDAAFYDEATATADEQNAFGEISLTGCELAKAITVTWKLRTMAMDEFIPFIINELGERVGAALGKSISVGKGKPGQGDSFKPEPLGIETALLAENLTPQVVSYDPEAVTPDPLAYEDFTTAIGKIHSSYLAGSAIYANNKTIWTQLANLKDGEGRPLFIPDLTAGGVGRMFGMVVKADAGVTDGSVIIGNPYAGYVLNTAEPMSVATEEHVKARTVDYAAYTIVDGAVLDNKAFALIRDTPGI